MNSIKGLPLTISNNLSTKCFLSLAVFPVSATRKEEKLKISISQWLSVCLCFEEADLSLPRGERAMDGKGEWRVEMKRGSGIEKERRVNEEEDRITEGIRLSVKLK